MVVDPVTNAALSGLKIEMSEGKNRYATTSSADGSFALPLEKKYFDENPYLVVTGVMPNGYKVVPVPKPVVVEAPVTPQNDVGSADAGTGGNMEPAAPVKAP